jgi:hypothetical protein
VSRSEGLSGVGAALQQLPRLTSLDAFIHLLLSYSVEEGSAKASVNVEDCSHPASMQALFGSLAAAGRQQQGGGSRPLLATAHVSLSALHWDEVCGEVGWGGAGGERGDAQQRWAQRQQEWLCGAAGAAQALAACAEEVRLDLDGCSGKLPLPLPLLAVLRAAVPHLAQQLVKLQLCYFVLSPDALLPLIQAACPTAADGGSSSSRGGSGSGGVVQPCCLPVLQELEVIMCEQLSPETLQAIAHLHAPMLRKVQLHMNRWACSCEVPAWVERTHQTKVTFAGMMGGTPPSPLPRSLPLTGEHRFAWTAAARALVTQRPRPVDGQGQPVGLELAVDLPGRVVKAMPWMAEAAGRGEWVTVSDAQGC